MRKGKMQKKKKADWQLNMDQQGKTNVPCNTDRPSVPGEPSI